MVTSAKPIGPFQLLVSFADGEHRIVDLRRALRRRRGLFAKLRDPEFFCQVKVSPSRETVVWPNGADIDPEVLYGTAHHGDIVVRKADAATTSNVEQRAGLPFGDAAHEWPLKA